MSSLSSIYIKKETLEVLLKTLEAKGEKGISIDVSISDEANNWGQNVSSYVSQTKEQREAKTKRFYVGNGKCFWTNGTIVVAEKQHSAPAPTAQPTNPALEPEAETNDLPF